MKREKQYALTVTLFVAYILLLTAVILFKLPFYSPEISNGIRIINPIPFHGSFDKNGILILREIIQNTLLFIPLGIYVCMLKSKRSFIRKMFPIIGLTLSFEVLQFIFALGISDITDIIDNTIGGIIGIGIYTLLFRIFTDNTVKVINILAFAATVCAAVQFFRLLYISYFVMSYPLLQISLSFDNEKIIGLVDSMCKTSVNFTGNII